MRMRRRHERRENNEKEEKCGVRFKKKRFVRCMVSWREKEKQSRGKKENEIKQCMCDISEQLFRHLHHSKLVIMGSGDLHFKRNNNNRNGTHLQQPFHTSCGYVSIKAFVSFVYVFSIKFHYSTIHTHCLLSSAEGVPNQQKIVLTQHLLSCTLLLLLPPLLRSTQSNTLDFRRYRAV